MLNDFLREFVTESLALDQKDIDNKLSQMKQNLSNKSKLFTNNNICTTNRHLRFTIYDLIILNN
jgi:septation ring formation regulator EzrA